MSETATRQREDLQKIISDAFISVLSQSSGNVWNQAAAQDPQNDVAFTNDFRFSGAVEGLLRVECDLHDARSISRVLLGGEEVSGSDLTAEEQEAVEEFFRQVVGLAQTECSSRFGELNIKPAPLDQAVEVSSRTLLSAAFQGSTILFAIRLDTPLQRCFPDYVSLDQPEKRNSNLDLLMNVTLPVVMRFGERQMRLRDILELGSGAVVELNRKESDPVELLLDNKLLARGEVVIVEGNYGFRVLEVVTSRERIQAAAR